LCPPLLLPVEPPEDDDVEELPLDAELVEDDPDVDEPPVEVNPPDEVEVEPPLVLDPPVEFEVEPTPLTTGAIGAGGT
jgi:hypothetical protein